MSFQTEVLDGIARVVGGTVSTGDPRFFNGVSVPDGTGIQGLGLVGCYSVPPAAVNVTPIAIVLVDEFDLDLLTQGSREDVDKVRLLVLVAPYAAESQMAKLTPFRDAVPAAFHAHMQLFSAPSAMDAVVIHGAGGIHRWDGIEYMAYEFIVRVRRDVTVTLVP